MNALAGLPKSLETTVVKLLLVYTAHLPLNREEFQGLQGLGKQENKIDYMSIKKERKVYAHAHVTRVYARIGIFSHLFSDGREDRIMREGYIERALAQEVKKRGGLALKFVSPGLSGVPDRLVLLPSRRIAFVEVKATGEKLRPLQIKRKRQLEELGFLVYCLDDIDAIGGMLDEICTA